jgi:FAD/FMN-containing dehydrogenase
MSTTTLGDATIAELREAIRGEAIGPQDPTFDDARRVWNGAHDRRPALVVRCRGTGDVVRALELARSEGLAVAVRGGGHSIPGFSTCDDGMVIDLSPMAGVHVDREHGRAIAQGGTTWGDFDAETQTFGLATTGGLVSTTGLGGFTLGGGIGWLMRKHGLACDNLVAADVVTADGRVIRAAEDADADLLWALRGGGGNFGIATSLEYRVHPVGPVVYGGPIFYPGDQARKVLELFARWTPELPDELTTFVNLLTAPPAPFLPEEWHGRKLVALVGVYAGPIEAGAEVMSQARHELGEPVADLCGPIPYTAMQSLLDALYPKGITAYMKSGFLTGLDAGAIGALCDRHDQMTTPQQEIHIHHMGGAVSRVGQDASPFPDRTSPYVLNLLATAPDGDGFDGAIGWAQETYAAAEPFTSGRAYVNFMGQGDDRIAQAYEPATFARLRELKRRYDPDNVFRLNQNIPPA